MYKMNDLDGEDEYHLLPPIINKYTCFFVFFKLKKYTVT